MSACIRTETCRDAASGITVGPKRQHVRHLLAVILLASTRVFTAQADWPQFAPPEFNWLQSEERSGPLLRWRSDSPVESPEESPIATDRPDFTESSSAVGAGVGQLETGYTFVMDREEGTTQMQHSLPETLLRVGVFRDWLELRLGWNFSAQYLPASSSSGAEDLYVGMKLGLTAQDGLFPEVSLVPQMTLPTGSTSHTAGRALPGANLLYGWDISDVLSAGGGSQFNQTIDDGTGTEFTEFAQSLTCCCSLNDQLGTYTEWFAFFPAGADTARTEHYINGGFTYRPTDDIQWDLRIGMGVNGAADDLFCGVGYSIRWH